MVWRGNCRGGIWRCLACKRARGQRRDLDQPMGGSSSSWRVDQPMGSSSSSRQMGQYVGSPSRWMGQLVVTETVDKFACPRKPILR
jgi:hypothetical protein